MLYCSNKQAMIFNMVEEHSTAASPNKTNSSVVVGLRILTQTSFRKSNVIVKPAFKISLPDSRNNGSETSPADQSCYLKSCHLCHKNLSLDKEVYMYRGDQGFCSIRCRERQIALDEMKELELSTKQMLASHRPCSAAVSTGRQEIRLLIEDLRRRNQSHHQNQNQNHWAIVS